MKYWIDTEFIAKPFTIDLVSIGLVAEDGREFYAESSEVDWSKASPWTLRMCARSSRARAEARGDRLRLRAFTDGDEQPVFWGYFPAYDWVAFAWLFGGPRSCRFHYRALSGHEAMGDRAAIRSCPVRGDRHNALADARWTKEAWAYLAGLDPAGTERRALGHKNPDQVGARRARL